jgi:hypothetical protein
MSATMTFALLVAVTVLSVYLTGRLAERRGRSHRTWAWVAAAIGPFALPLLWLFPDRRRRHGGAIEER